MSPPKYTEEEYRHAQEVMHECGSYHMQKRNKAGVWKSFGQAIHRLSTANEMLNQAKKQLRKGESEKDFRVLPKPEADAYAQGFSDGRFGGESRDERRRARVRKPLVFLPEHL